MSDTSQSLAHARWHGKYHVVFVPKWRRKTMYGNSRKALGAIFHELARQRNAGSLKATSCRIMSICVSRFHPSMRWPP